MPRKTNFTVPMDNVVEVVSRTQRTKRGLRTSEKEVPIHSSHQAKSGKASRSNPKDYRLGDDAQAQGSRSSPHETEESHSLQPMEPQEDDILAFEAEDGPPHNDVCYSINLLSFTVRALMVCRHQWVNG